MRIKKEKRTYKQAVVNVTILVLVLGLFLYLGIQFSRNFSNSVSTQRTQTFTDVEYSYFDGYIFRDETPLTQSESGVCDYLAEDGARIGTGKEYGVFYPYSGGAKDKQAQLDGISERIRRLNSKFSADGYVSELPGVEETLKNSYYSYVNSVLDGNFSSADASGDRLLDALVDRNVITGREGAAKDLTDALLKQKAEIIESLGSSGRTLVSEESFYLSYSTDGFESLFSSQKLEEITPLQFESLVKKAPETYGDMVIGKQIHSPEWFFAMPISQKDALRFMDGEGNARVGERYEVTFSDEGDTMIIMTLDSIRTDEQGNCLMILSCFDMAKAYGFSRAQSVKIKMSSVTGYRIPAESLTEREGESGVYILVGTVVEFRRVTVISEGNGYYVVDTYEKDAENKEGADAASEYPYLNVNDLIITSGNDLYDGKLID